MGSVCVGRWRTNSANKISAKLSRAGSAPKKIMIEVRLNLLCFRMSGAAGRWFDATGELTGFREAIRRRRTDTKRLQEINFSRREGILTDLPLSI
jgi:hypothetical protein